MTDTHEEFPMVRVGRLGAGSRRGLFVAGLAVAVLVAVLPAWAHTPETGLDPNVTLTVTPADGLSDGQTVTATGTGFAPNSSGLIRQCGGSVAAPECDTTIAATFITTATGAMPPTPVTVRRIITTWTTSFNCSTQACALVATAAGSTRHHIGFASAGTVSSTTPTSSVPTTFVPTTFVPTTFVPTTVSPTTAVPTTFGPTTIPPSTTVPPTGNLVCDILMALRGVLGGILSGLIDGLLAFFGCPPAG